MLQKYFYKMNLLSNCLNYWEQNHADKVATEADSY